MDHLRTSARKWRRREDTSLGFKGCWLIIAKLKDNNCFHFITEVWTSIESYTKYLPKLRPKLIRTVAAHKEKSKSYIKSYSRIWGSKNNCEIKYSLLKKDTSRLINSLAQLKKGGDCYTLIWRKSNRLNQNKLSRK